MKLSELTAEVIMTHCGVSDSSEETVQLLGMYKAAATAFILGYTGIPTEKLDSFEDITVACCCIIDDMYNNRSMTVSCDRLNPTARQILDMHSRNLLA